MSTPNTTMSSSSSSSSSSNTHNKQKPLVIPVKPPQGFIPASALHHLTPPPQAAAATATKKDREPPTNPQSTAPSRGDSESEGSDNSDGECEDLTATTKSPQVDGYSATQGAFAIDDGFQMDICDDQPDVFVDDGQPEIKVKSKPAASRKKTTKAADAKPRAEAKSSSGVSNKRHTSSKSAKAKIAAKNEEIMPNSNLKYSEILSKTCWLPKITENVIKKFELLKEGDTIVNQYWISVPTETSKVYLLMSMDGRKWWGNRDVTAYIDGGNLKIGVDCMVIKREDGNLVYGRVPASLFK